jgi:glycosyltransferase involved in cell wall biosynthesis
VTLRVHHFGPDRRYVGGMASVLGTLADNRVGADEVILHPTYVPGSHPRSAWLTTKAIAGLARISRADVVHVHLSERGSFVREGAVVHAAHRLGRPTAVTLHGADFADFSEDHRRLSGSVLRAADAVTVLSEESLAIVNSLAPDVASYLIPNPVVVDHLPEAASRQPPRILFAGEIGRRKGADILLQAWPRVRDAHPDAVLTIVGPAGDVDVTVGAGIERLTERSPSEIRDLIRTSRLVVLPSRAEAMPMILLEAMSAARPFVATPVGGVPAIADGAGLLVPVADAPALAIALIDLLSDPSRSDELGNSGYASTARLRGVGVVGPVMRSMYESMTAGR